jgi:ubiquinone/menaquinone biosynthesis C-methylase UbiE
LRRLQTLSLLYRDVTRRWLERAGIGPGMSVVDVGCGPGDVTLLVGDLVGPTGSVTGVDSSPEALARARTRVEAAETDAVLANPLMVGAWARIP